MARINTAEDAARAVLNLIRGVSGDHPGTTGGKRQNRRDSPVKKRPRRSAGMTDTGDGGGDTGGETGGGFSTPMTQMWSIIRGGAGGGMIEMPLGPDGTVLASIGGQLIWAYPTQLGVPVSYLTFMDGVTEYDVTDASDVALWA